MRTPSLTFENMAFFSRAAHDFAARSDSRSADRPRRGATVIDQRADGMALDGVGFVAIAGASARPQHALARRRHRALPGGVARSLGPGRTA